MDKIEKQYKCGCAMYSATAKKGRHIKMCARGSVLWRAYINEQNSSLKYELFTDYNKHFHE